MTQYNDWMLNPNHLCNIFCGEVEYLNKNIEPHDGRITWEEYFAGLLMWVSVRSHDVHTQCSCIITNKENQILGTGYNGFIRGADDRSLPLERPAKYKWMMHGELNALANCVMKPVEGVAWICGPPCLQCAQMMHQFGITKFVIFNINSPKMCETNEYNDDMQTFYNNSHVEVVYYNLSKEWVDNAVKRFRAAFQSYPVSTDT